HVWLVTARGSVKARSIRRSPHVGILFRTPERSLAVRGRAEILSFGSISDAARLISKAPAATFALGAYGARNLSLLGGYALDLCRLPAGGLPFDRVLVAVRPEASVFVPTSPIASIRDAAA